MESKTPKNAWLSEVNPEFAPLIPGVNEAFKKIWTYSDMTEFRGNWTTTRATYADYVPTTGFDVTHQMVPTSDGTEVEIRILKPEGAGNELLPLLFVLHGGGWVVGGHDSENSMSRSVCVKNRVLVLSVDYRRAPEHKFPTALNDGYDVYKWTMKNAAKLGIDTTKIFLGGQSAGANLIAGLTLKLRDEGALDGVIGQLLNIPAVCHPKQFPHDKYELLSYEQNKDAPTVNGNHMHWFWDQYYPEAGPDPLASPLLASSHKGLPPALVQVGGLDALRDEGIAYAEALEAAGVPTTLKVYPGLPHGFALAIKMEFTTRYIRSMVEWVAEQLGEWRGKVVVFSEPGVPLQIREESSPQPAHTEILVQVEFAGVCGTDLHRLSGHLPPSSKPICFGHEGVGVVVSVGSEFGTDWAGEALAAGDRVYWLPSTPCMHCAACQSANPLLCADLNWPVAAGGPNAACFREYATLKKTNTVYKIPKGTKPEDVIVFGCAMPTALRGFRRLGPIGPDDDVIVQGSGPVGLAATLLAHLAGARNIIVIGDPPIRLEWARKLGATETLVLSRTTVEHRRMRVQQITKGVGASVIVEAAGHPAAFPEGFDLLGRNGRYLILGLYSGQASTLIDPVRINNLNLSIIGSLGIEADTYQETIRIATEHGQRLGFGDMVTHRFRMDEIEKAIRTIGSSEAVKVLVMP